MDRTLPKNLIKALFLIILLAGLALRAYQYGMGRSLWHDEAHLALNFVYSGYKVLLKPLENYQSAPILFLYGVETCTRLFGFGELALRAFPFLLSVAVLPLFYYLAKEVTGSKIAALFALLIYSLNISLIYYSSEIKPYTIDVSVFILLSYLVVSPNAFVAKHRTVMLIISGILCVFLSNATEVVFVSAVLYMARGYRFTRNTCGEKVFEISAKDVIIIGIWIVAFLLNFFAFIYDHPYAGGMKDLWKDTFSPVPFSGPEFHDFIYRRFDELLFSDMLLFSKGLLFPYIVLALSVIATLHIIYKRRFSVFLFTLLPIVIHLLLSVAKLYPFHLRFILYLLPCIILLISYGIGVVWQFCDRRLHWSLGLAIVLFCGYQATNLSLRQFPRWDIKIKPALSYIDAHYRNTQLFVTTPFTMYKFYQMTGFVHNDTYKDIPWNLTPENYFEVPAIREQKTNYILLHSIKGGDNIYPPIIDELNKRKLIVKQYHYNDFAVTEIRPADTAAYQK